MNADRPKVLLSALGRPLVDYVIAAARSGGARRVIVVVGFGREQVVSALRQRSVEFAVQSEPRGTADAVLACQGMIAPEEDVIVLCGDAPLISPGSIRQLAEARKAVGATIAILTAVLSDPAGYGRIIRDERGDVARIVECCDAKSEELEVHEVNSGVYSFNWGEVLPVLKGIKPSPSSGEYYLTDIVAEVVRTGRRVIGVQAANPEEMLGANTPQELEQVVRILAERHESLSR